MFRVGTLFALDHVMGWCSGSINCTHASTHFELYISYITDQQPGNVFSSI